MSPIHSLVTQQGSRLYKFIYLTEITFRNCLLRNYGRGGVII